MSWKFLLGFVCGAMTGGLIELAISVALESKFQTIYKRLRRRWFWLQSRLSRGELAVGPDQFCLGPWRVKCLVLEGTAAEPYSDDDIICRLSNEMLELPAGLADVKSDIEERERRVADTKGLPTYSNGPMVVFEDYSHSRTAGLEEPLLALRFSLTDYYTYLATSMSLDRILKDPNREGYEITIRDKYLIGVDFRHPVKQLATSFGVNMAVVTKDGYLLFARRSLDKLANYRGRWAVPICESVNPTLDKREGQLDVFYTARRGSFEELGLSAATCDMRFFSLVVDPEFYLYGLTGLLEMPEYTLADVLSCRSRGIKDKWESTEIRGVPFEPRGVTAFIHEVGGPNYLVPSSFVAIVQTLMTHYSEPEIKKAMRRIV